MAKGALTPGLKLTSNVTFPSERAKFVPYANRPQQAILVTKIVVINFFIIN